MQNLPCPLNCGIHGLRPADLVHHVRNECSHRTTPCHACGAVIKSKDLDRHLREKCSIQHGSSWSPDNYHTQPYSRSPMTRSTLSPSGGGGARMPSARAPPPSTRSDYSQRSYGEMPAAPWSPQNPMLRHGSPNVSGYHSHERDQYSEHTMVYEPSLSTQRSMVPTTRHQPSPAATSELHTEVAQLRSELAAQHQYSERLATELMVLRADLCGSQANRSEISQSPHSSPIISHSNGRRDVSMPPLPAMDKTETERKIQEYVDNIFTGSSPSKPLASSRSSAGQQNTARSAQRKPRSKSRASSRAPSVASEAPEYLDLSLIHI
eukprot:TRINITY_DN1969_c0_g1_i3.p1 TRINITY_DN1969_c0_g1~~TRINITY_DN1969_c0_g1_i3.p1  ORF type:complete len:322 (-),score=48.68 TRINITY_DN1969_c0_g1_i3:106-1071(-)